jgi:predicted ATP-grasp superfamily ATP-dependent carboligase
MTDKATGVMRRQQRWDYLLQRAVRYSTLDVVNAYLVEDYVEETGAKSKVMWYGADKCPLLGRDLSAMEREGLLSRYRTGLSDMHSMGFPSWVWVYSLTDKGRARLEELKVS